MAQRSTHAHILHRIYTSLPNIPRHGMAFFVVWFWECVRLKSRRWWTMAMSKTHSVCAFFFQSIPENVQRSIWFHVVCVTVPLALSFGRCAPAHRCVHKRQQPVGSSNWKHDIGSKYWNELCGSQQVFVVVVVAVVDISFFFSLKLLADPSIVLRWICHFS